MKNNPVFNANVNAHLLANLAVARQVVDASHPDMQLFEQDRHRRSFCCILYPATNEATSLLIHSLRESPTWLTESEILDINEELVQASKPTLAEIITQSKAFHAGNGALALTQRIFPMKHLPHVIWHCQGKLEHYLAQCSFQGWARSSDTVNQLTSCWVDLDYYKLNNVQTKVALTNDVTAVEWISKRCTEGIGGRFFLPTQIIRSGRGLYIKWIFSHFLPGTAAPRWRRCMEKLVEIFANFGADPAAKDAARVLRITGSTNSKSRSQACILYTGKPILFDTLAEAVLPRQRANSIDKTATKTLAKNMAKQFGPRKKVLLLAEQETTGQALSIKINPHSWPVLVAHEIKKLMEMRGADMRGHIELAAFIRLIFLLMSGKIDTETDFKNEVFEMGQLMYANQDQLLSKVKNVWTRHQAKGNQYRFKKKTVIDRLEISAIELLELPCLAKALGSQKTRKPTVQTRATLAENQKEALLLEQSGMQLNQIAVHFDVSPKTVKRWLIEAQNRPS